MSDNNSAFLWAARVNLARAERAEAEIQRLCVLLDKCQDRLGAFRNDLPALGIREDYNDDLIAKCRAAAATDEHRSEE